MILSLLALALTAELPASAAVWHGTPTDWPGDEVHWEGADVEATISALPMAGLLRRTLCCR